MKKQKGITLIALVITIIVLIILSGVSISLIVGDNGILDQAILSKNSTEISQYSERIKIALNAGKGKALTSGNSVLEETQAIILEDDYLEGVTLGEIKNNQFTVETKEGYVFTVTENSVIFDETTTEGSEEGDTGSTEEKVVLTVKHIDTSGTELQETSQEEYNLNEYITVESLEIDGYETYALKIVAAENNEMETDGAPVKMSFSIYQDTEVTIIYSTISSEDGENGSTEETAKDYSTVATIKQASTAIKSTPIEADSEVLDDIQTELEDADDYYAMDIEPIESNSGPLTIVFDMSDKAVDGDTATVRHKRDNGTWENLGNYTVQNLQITVTIDSFSPFVIEVKHVVTAENNGFIQGWKHYSNGTWSETITNEAELVVSGDVTMVAKICKGSGTVTPGWITYMDRETYFDEGDQLKLIITGSGNMGDVAIFDDSGAPTAAYAWQATGMQWYLGELDNFIIPYVTSISIDSRITSIGAGAFAASANLRTISMPNVTKIGNHAFYYCTTLYSLTIPSSVTNIGKDAFSNCNTISQIRIPESVNQIGVNAFLNDYSLRRIYIDGSPTSIGQNAFNTINSKYIYVKSLAIQELVESSYINEGTAVKVVE